MDKKANRFVLQNIARRAMIERGLEPDFSKEVLAGLSLSFLKLLGSGEYVVETPGSDTQGHFGLAVKDYTHSTAPNRRYPDLITQCLLKAAISGTSVPYQIDKLEQIAQHCTLKEDDVMKFNSLLYHQSPSIIITTRQICITENDYQLPSHYFLSDLVL